MKQSQLFAKTSRKLSESEASKNAQFLIRAGFIDKSSAGVYTILPLGLRVLEKIKTVVREEMNFVEGEELSMPALIQKKYWEKSNRWDVDVVYKTSTGTVDQDGKPSFAGLRTGKDFEYGLGWTHEEVITAIATKFINSYKDLPCAVYQFQNKFRAEARPQAGLLRGREFLMKDLYSFHESKEDLDSYYEKVIEAYKKVFKRLGLKTLIAEAGGGAFTKEYTHEFQVLNPAGEDTIFYCEKCGFCQNQEIYKPEAHGDCKEQIKNGRSIEVGNIFKLGTRYSEAYNLNFLNKEGKKNAVIMGSYGIGITRALGVIVEELSDEYGIIWPKTVAPFQVHLVELGSKNSNKTTKTAKALYEKMIKEGIEVLYDDREASIGEKLNDADLMGIPNRVVVSEKTLAASTKGGSASGGKKVELKIRGTKKTELISEKELLSILKK